MAFFTRYIMQGMVKSSTNDVYWEVMRLRRTMACARLGFESWNSTPQVAILIHQVQNLRLIEPLYTRFTQNSMSIDTLYPVIYMKVDQIYDGLLSVYKELLLVIVDIHSFVYYENFLLQSIIIGILLNQMHGGHHFDTEQCLITLWPLVINMMQLMH